MKVLFIADPMASFKTYKDTTYAMMREMAKRGWQLFHTLSGELSVNGGLVTAQASAFEFLGAKADDDHAWFKSAGKVQTALKEFDAVIMRTDPPTESEIEIASEYVGERTADQPAQQRVRRELHPESVQPRRVEPHVGRVEEPRLLRRDAHPIEGTDSTAHWVPADELLRGSAPLYPDGVAGLLEGWLAR